MRLEKMFDTPRHCGRVWSTSVSILKMHFDWTCLSIFSSFRALQYSYLYPVQTEQMFRCLMCWNIKRTLLARALALFVLFMMKPGESTAGFEGQFFSPAVFEKNKKKQKNNNHPTVKTVYDRTTLYHSCSRRRPANEHVERLQRDEGFNTPGTCSPLIINNLRY